MDSHRSLPDIVGKHVVGDTSATLCGETLSSRWRQPAQRDDRHREYGVE